jgi:SAM-dependent methyltransferase
VSVQRIFDRHLLVRHRDRMAAGASHHDFLLARVADDLMERLGAVKRRFPRAASLGAYHGLIGRRLRQVPGIEQVTDVEASPRLLAQCDGPRLQADEEALPFAEASLDLVVSGLSLQLVNDLPGTLLQVCRVLKPDGLMLAALLGGATLTELRTAFLIAEEEMEGGASPRVAPFADVRDLGGLLQRAGLALPVADSDTVTVTYRDPLALMLELRAMGASNPLVERSRRPLRRATLARAIEVYTERFALPDGRVPATFEIVTLTAWAPHPSQPKPLRPGSATTRLADVLGKGSGKGSDPASRKGAGRGQTLRV